MSKASPLLFSIGIWIRRDSDKVDVLPDVLDFVVKFTKEVTTGFRWELDDSGDGLAKCLDVP